MSSKSAKPAKKLTVPRELVEIQKEYNNEVLKAGQLQYQILIQSRDLESVNNRLETLNKEAFARNALDAQAKTEQSSGN